MSQSVLPREEREAWRDEVARLTIDRDRLRAALGDVIDYAEKAVADLMCVEDDPVRFHKLEGDLASVKAAREALSQSGGCACTSPDDPHREHARSLCRYPEAST